MNTASFDAIFGADGDMVMRTTINFDDDLVAKAQTYTGLQEKSALVHEALLALIARESAKRLALLGGSQPDAQAGPRRRSTVR